MATKDFSHFKPPAARYKMFAWTSALHRVVIRMINGFFLKSPAGVVTPKSCSDCVFFISTYEQDSANIMFDQLLYCICQQLSIPSPETVLEDIQSLTQCTTHECVGDLIPSSLPVTASANAASQLVWATMSMLAMAVVAAQTACTMNASRDEQKHEHTLTKRQR